ncbi:hypothetical protein HOD75_00095 [archaeon]|jgi:hypothetical protein|nr:hypothetical protein [Candidatus Woesearchaeota archaeon]MBT4136052.1 hypothetical protein [archaeon]MBT4241277.1 hypothetical protein [archaeon]MBT4418099.1 hypothetical protein [archaeon]
MENRLENSVEVNPYQSPICNDNPNQDGDSYLRNFLWGVIIGSPVLGTVCGIIYGRGLIEKTRQVFENFF